MPLINAHVYVSKVRYSMVYFDSENTGGITSVCSVFYDNIDLQRKKCGISNLVVKGIKIRLQVYIENICISHMRKSPCLIKADVGEARKPCRSKSINH